MRHSEFTGANETAALYLHCHNLA